MMSWPQEQQNIAKLEAMTSKASLDSLLPNSAILMADPKIQTLHTRYNLIISKNFEIKLCVITQGSAHAGRRWSGVAGTK